MGSVTKIEWADKTFNPWQGCTKIAPGCKFCYAESIVRRFNKAAWGPNGTRVKTSEANWRKPVKWNRDAAGGLCIDCGKPICDSGTAIDCDCGQLGANGQSRRPRVFCASLADVFEDWQGSIVDHHGSRLILADSERVRGITMADLRRDLFALIDATPHLDWLILTKRPENVRRMWPSRDRHYGKHLDSLHNPHFRENCWIGTSISDQATADANIPELLKLRDLSPVLFVSAEPLLGLVEVGPWMFSSDGFVSTPNDGPIHRDDGGAAIDWLIVGCESNGKRVGRLGEFTNARQWQNGARVLLSQCCAANVPAFVKQVPIDGRVSHDPDEWAEDLRVRQWPEVARA